MNRALVVTLVGLGALGCSEPVGGSSAPVIYGNDDRTEIYAVPDGVHRTAAETAVAMQTDADSLDRSNPDDIRITYAGILGETEGLCADVAYYDQPDPGYCSGTLIDDRHILTAGHCVETADDCSPQWPWVFGYYYESEGTFRTITADDVYECVDRVVFRNDLEGDYAVIELDRPVVGHTPATLRGGSDAAPNGTPLTLIGHPNGIPMKVAGDATVLDYDGQELFTDLDAFFGNSGSGVWNDAGLVVGILVAGSPADYQRRPGGMGCFELVQLSTGDDFEYVQPVHVPWSLFCATGVESTACEDAPEPVDMGPPPASDGGTPRSDDGGALPGADAGTGGMDDAGAAGGGGCGCRTAAGSSPSVALLVLVLFGLRRRQRGRS